MQACKYQKKQDLGKGGNHACKYAGMGIVLSEAEDGSSAEFVQIKKPLHANMQGPWLKSRKAFIPPWVSVEPSCAAFWALPGFYP